MTPTTWIPRTSGGRAVLCGGEPIWLLEGTDIELRKLAGEWSVIRSGATVVGRGRLRDLYRSIRDARLK